MYLSYTCPPHGSVRIFRRQERWARTGKIKLRDAAFNTLTRQARFELPARDDITFRHLMLDLFDKEWPPGKRRAVRLVGFGVTDITTSPEDPQPSLFGPSPLAEQMKKRERLAAALDKLPALRGLHRDGQLGILIDKGLREGRNAALFP